MKIGDPCTYVDAKGVEHAAVVTAVWNGMQSPASEPGVNLVFVSTDETKGDTYGRQIERNTSVCHESVQPAHGNYWK